MKKKIFTLMALLSMAVTGVWAQTTLFSWTSKTGLSNADISAGTYTFTNAAPGDYLTSVSGGTVEMVVPSNGNMRIRGSQLAYNSNNSYYHITLSQALEKGDKIDINSSGNTNNLWFSTTTSRPKDAVSASAVIVQGTTYTLATGNALIGQTEFYVWRASSTTQLGTFTITRPAPSTDPEITAEDAAITTKISGEEVTKDIAVEGINLTGSTLTATLSPAVTGLSVTLASNTISEGAISTTATLHYTQTENASGVTTLTLSDGTTEKDITITYKSKVVLTTLQPISTETIWDFTTDVTGAVQFSGDDQNTEYVYADIDNLTFAPTFDENALAFKGEYPFRGNSNKYAQNGTLHFQTSVPGSIIVKFSDTGTSASSTAVKRYLIVNDIPTDYWTSREKTGDGAYAANLNITTDEIAVPAGDVTITGSSAIIVQYLKFTPATATNVSLNGDGYATYSNYYDVEVSGATAYSATLDFSAETITCTEIAGGKVPAGAGVLLFGEAGAEVTLTPTTGAAALGANSLHGTTTANGTLVEKGSNDYYVLNGSSFMRFTGDAFTANKAYFEVSGGVATARDWKIVFNGSEATGLDAISTAQSATVNAVYNLAGQRVAAPLRSATTGEASTAGLKKGLYIVGGKKIVLH